MTDSKNTLTMYSKQEAFFPIISPSVFEVSSPLSFELILNNSESGAYIVTSQRVGAGKHRYFYDSSKSDSHIKVTLDRFYGK